MRRVLALAAAVALGCGGDAGDDPRALLAGLALGDETPPPDPTNRVADDPAAAAFGQRLFFDPGFSGRLLDGDNDGGPDTLGVRGETGKVACAGCHAPDDGFADGRSPGHQISLAAGWVLRRTPSLLDVAHARLVTWDGRRDSTWSQVVGPLESPDEMNSSRLYVAQEIARRHATEYQALFGALPPLLDATRFPQLTAEDAGCTRAPGGVLTCNEVFDALPPDDQTLATTVVVNMGKALGAYQRRLACGPGAFDAWLAGDDAALEPAAVRGAALFAGRAGCLDCHDGPHLSDQRFHNVGLAPATVAVVFRDDGDRGAAVGLPALLVDPLRSTGTFSDGADDRLDGLPAGDAREGAFRTPTLRCVAGRPSFMHTGQFVTLDEVVAFFARGGHPAGYPGVSELAPLELSGEEQADLVAFLRALDGPGPPAALRTPP